MSEINLNEKELAFIRDIYEEDALSNLGMVETIFGEDSEMVDRYRKMVSEKADDFKKTLKAMVVAFNTFDEILNKYSDEPKKDKKTKKTNKKK